jgi:glucans biosynthesis protein
MNAVLVLVNSLSWRHAAGALLAALTLSGSAVAQSLSQTTVATPETAVPARRPAAAPVFGFDNVAGIARKRAAQPWKAISDKPGSNLPPELRDITYDQHRDIRFKPDQALWRDASLPFETMFFHLGLYQTEPVLINEITPEGVKHIAYDRSRFDYGKNTFNPDNWGDLGFAGFRAHFPLNSPDYKDELVVFLGASYFRALGAGQGYGLSARGLAIDTVGGSSEEFPRFSEFWLQRPAADDKSLTIFALLESPRATGAYRFDITPGKQTTTKVTARVYLRAGTTAPAMLGIAPLTSMFFFGENQPNLDDFRPEVHDSDGLMVATGEGEWLWRPLQNPKEKTVTSFATTNPRGFGLMQRDRKFVNYEDSEARYERRPSAWVKPLGDWGPGRVELVMLSTPDETHDNIVAYWVPAKLPAAGAPLDFSYELHWQGDAPQQPPNGHVVQTRRGIGFNRLSAEELRTQTQYVIDFAGPSLQDLPANAPVRAVASTDANGRVTESLVYRNAATGAWRMTLRVQRIDPARPVELRAFLQHVNDIVSETWTNIILPE